MRHVKRWQSSCSSMFLITTEHVILCHYAFKRASAGTVHDRQYWPARKIMQRAVERHVRKEDGRPLSRQDTLQRRVWSRSSARSSQFIGSHGMPASVPERNQERRSVGFCKKLRGIRYRLCPFYDRNIDRPQSIFKMQLGFFPRFFHGGQLKPILMRKDFEDRNRL